MTYEVTITGHNGKPQTFQVELVRNKQTDEIMCRVDGETVSGLDARSSQREILSLLLGTKSYEVRRDTAESQSRIVIGEETFTYEVRDPRSLGARRAKAASHDGPKKIKAPMPGKVVRILAGEGTHVEAGQGVLVIEAMKMQNEMKSPKAGVVKKILAAEGTTVNAGDALAEIE
jgi:biotin carboxyl carrier protein